MVAAVPGFLANIQFLSLDPVFVLLGGNQRAHVLFTSQQPLNHDGIVTKPRGGRGRTKSFIFMYIARGFYDS